MSGFVVAISIAIYLAVVSFYLYDLFAISRRKRKPIWIFVLILLPVVGIVIYEASKNRRKRITRWF